MLSGRAGIGESRVLRTFREKIADQPHSRALYHGSVYHQNIAFYPVNDQLEHALRFESNDSVEKRLEKYSPRSTDQVLRLSPPCLHWLRFYPWI